MQFYFDYISPYAYLASTQVRAIAARHGRSVDAVPVLFAAMLDATGAVGPAEITAKRHYMHADVDRLAATLGVPIEPPATHPFNPLLALRVTGCIADRDDRWRAVDVLYRAVWAESARIDEPAAVEALLSHAGLAGTALVAAAATETAKQALRAATDRALAAGAFGVPTIVAGDELFWGVDSLPLLDRWLAGELRRDPARDRAWRAVAPSANRRRS